MAGIADSEVIDVFAQDADGTYLLVMVEDRPWGSDPHQLDQLKAKINAYADMVLSGQLETLHPEVTGRSVAIRLDCAAAPTGDFAAVTEWATRYLREKGVPFSVHVW